MKLRDRSIEPVKPEHLALALQHFERIQQVRGQLRQAFDGLQPALPADPAKADALRGLFLSNLENGHEFELHDGGSISIYRDGQRLDNRQGHPVRLQDYVRDLAAQSFDLEAAPGTAGNQPPAGATGRRFKDGDDYVRQYDSAKTKEERSQIVAAWNKQNQ